MPSVDPARMYPPSPSMAGGAPPADSPERGGHTHPQQPQHGGGPGGPYSYIPPGAAAPPGGPYGHGPPPGSMPPYHPMAQQGGDKAGSSYGQQQGAPAQMGQYPMHPGYGYMPPYAYGRPPPWMYEGGPPQQQGYGGYPSQHPMQRGPNSMKDQRGRSSRGGHSAGPFPVQQQQQHHQQQQQQHQQQQPQRPHPETLSKGREESASKDATSLPLQPSAQSATSVNNAQQPQSPHDVAEVELVKAAAAAEQGLAEVKPIQTDFHFFVMDMKEKLLEVATAEVDKSLKGKNEELIKKHRAYLINSNLNCRLMKEWEDVLRDNREHYFKKEEEDRQRFMEEDEVASRHCFTLTARIRSPSKKSALLALEEKKRLEEKEGTSDSKLGETTGSRERDASATETSQYDKQGKRSSDEIPEKEESPSKLQKSPCNA